MSSRDQRLELIKRIEQERNSKVLVYFCGDRPLAGANIADDAIRPLYDHLLALNVPGQNVDSVDLYLYALGGRLEVPWRIATMLREFVKRVNVIIPYKAYSAATLIALGADKIVMGKKGELSPIDPSLHVIVPEGTPPPALPPQIGVEDVSSYVTFVKERAGLTDQSALARTICILAEKLTPPMLGQIQRAHSHIRLVARKLLSLCQPPLEERRISAIVEALTEKIYLHGHGIGRKEAQEIGLQIEEPSSNVENLIWQLYVSYENFLKLRATADPLAYFPNDETDEYKEPDTVIACIESTEKLHVFKGTFSMKRVRKIPQQPTININLGLQLPPGIQPADIPAQVQQAIQQLLQQGAQLVREQVLKEIVKQSPIERIDGRFIGGIWTESAE